MSSLPGIRTTAALRAQARKERAAQIVANGAAMGLLAVGNLALAYAYGDVAQLVCFGGVAVCSAALTLLVPATAAERRRGYLATSALTCAAAVASMWVLGPGPGAAIILFAYGLAAVASAWRSWHAFALLATAVTLGYGAAHFAPLAARADAVPASATVLVSAAVSMAIILALILTDERRVREATATLASSHAGLAQEGQSLKVTRAELADAGDALATETRELTAEAAKAEDLTRRLARKRAEERQLVNAIHQDLREPLRNVISFGQLVARRLRGTPDEAKVGDYLGFAIDGGLRMTTMLEQLLSYTQDAGGAGELESVSIREVVDDVVRDLHDLATRSGARLHVAVDARCHVYGAPGQLRQLVLNLTNNAIKFSREGEAPQVWIGARLLDGGAVALSVRDAGIGIPAAQLEKVFGLFNRAHATDGYEGSGVGLALCRKIALAHGADLEVASAHGEGSTFSATFPSVDGVTPAPAPPPAATPAATLTPASAVPDGAPAIALEVLRDDR